MVNYIKEVKEELVNLIRNSIETAIKLGEFPEFEITNDDIIIEVPKEKANGEFSTNIAMKLAKKVRKAPKICAEAIIKNFNQEGTFIEKIECAGVGFINFHFKSEWLNKVIEIINKEKQDYGKSEIGKGQKVMVEFVSANPTGPLHMGNARGGALGDLIAGVLELTGHDVTREFYVNDAGNQISKFGISLEARYIQQLKGEDAIEFPEDGYHGEDIIEHVKNYIKENGDKLLDVSEEERRNALVAYALPKNISMIKSGLEKYGINYDVWFSEKSLYETTIIYSSYLLK